MAFGRRNVVVEMVFFGKHRAGLITCWNCMLSDNKNKMHQKAGLL